MSISALPLKWFDVVMIGELMLISWGRSAFRVLAFTSFVLEGSQQLMSILLWLSNCSNGLVANISVSVCVSWFPSRGDFVEDRSMFSFECLNPYEPGGRAAQP